MKIVKVSKFEIGEVVSFKTTSTTFLITEINTATCPAGTQVSYHGLVINNLRLSFDPKDCIADKYLTFQPETLFEKYVPKEEKKQDPKYKLEGGKWTTT